MLLAFNLQKGVQFVDRPMWPLRDPVPRPSQASPCREERVPSDLPFLPSKVGFTSQRDLSFQQRVHMSLSTCLDIQQSPHVFAVGSYASSWIEVASLPPPPWTWHFPWGGDWRTMPQFSAWWYMPEFSNSVSSFCMRNLEFKIQMCVFNMKGWFGFFTLNIQCFWVVAYPSWWVWFYQTLFEVL